MNASMTRHQITAALVIGFIVGWVLLPGLAIAQQAAHLPAHAATEPAASAEVESPSQQAGAGHGVAEHDSSEEHDISHAHEAEGHTDHDGHEAQGHGSHEAPSLIAVVPFAALLLCIAILPLIHRTEHWWHKNKNKFLIAAILAAITLAYYLLRGTGFHAEPGLPSVLKILGHAVLAEYVPFIVLLFSLYTISGGIQLRGDLEAKPMTNVAFLATGAALASFIGTTGASMLLIRPLLQANQERKYVKHTVIFFIFLVSNIGGCLLPIGYPRLFLA